VFSKFFDFALSGKRYYSTTVGYNGGDVVGKESTIRSRTTLGDDSEPLSLSWQCTKEGNFLPGFPWVHSLDALP